MNIRGGKIEKANKDFMLTDKEKKEKIKEVIDFLCMESTKIEDIIIPEEAQRTKQTRLKKGTREQEKV